MDAEPVVAATLLDPSVALALEVAQREAARRGHRQVGVEHMLLALLADPQLAHCVDRAGAKLEAARGHLEAALEERGPFRVESGDAGLGYRLARVLDLSQASAIPDDPLSLLSALVAESGAAVALAAEADLTPALWASSTLERAPAEAAPGSPYRSAHKTLGWTVSLRASEPLPAERLMAILAGTGLDDFGVARAMVVAATGRARPVGLFTEHDARSWVQVIEERAAAAGLSLTAEVMRCSPPAALLALRAKNLRWRWRVRGLWIAAAACLLGALIWAGLQWRELDRAPLSIEAARLAAPGERVRIKGRAEPAAPRYLLSEGVLFTADPRNPREVFSVFDDSLYRTRDVRVTFRAIPPASFTFEAERHLSTAGEARRTLSRWVVVTCNNCGGDVLLVGPTTPWASPIEASVRNVDQVGLPAEEIRSLHRAHGGTKKINYVLDVEPLPAGDAQVLVPICHSTDVIDVDCRPLMWASAEPGAPPDWAQSDTLEGELAISSDARLNLRFVNDPAGLDFDRSQPGEPGRILRIGPRTTALQSVVLGPGILSGGLALLLALGAWVLRRFGRPSARR